VNIVDEGFSLKQHYLPSEVILIDVALLASSLPDSISKDLIIKLETT